MADQALIDQIKNWLGSGSVNIFGQPFSGKDTQAKILAQALDAALIAGGDILRAYPDQDRIKQLSLTGKLFPQDFYLQIILPYLSKPEYARQPLVLSTVGRWTGEEQPVSQAAETSGHPIKAVINLRLDEAEIWRRREDKDFHADRVGRLDDFAQTLPVRLEEFKNKTLPVIEYYRQKELVCDIDAKGTPDEIAARIIEALAAKATIK